MKTVKELLESILTREGHEPDIESMVGMLEGSERVWEGERDHHRWYIRLPVVVKLEGCYIHYTDFITTGDQEVDTDEYNLDEAYFVERKEREIVEVYYE